MWSSPAGPGRSARRSAGTCWPLAVNAGEAVNTPVLIDRVWDEAPDAARWTVHTHIARLVRQSGG
jgi:DNA-binding response OmpR family regulator